MHEDRTDTLTAATAQGTTPPSPWARRLGRYGYRPSERVSLRARLVPPMPDGPGVPTGAPSPVLGRLGLHVPEGLWQFACRWAGWIGPLIITLFSAVLTFWKLGTPNSIIFDETYYAKDSWSI